MALNTELYTKIETYLRRNFIPEADLTAAGLPDERGAKLSEEGMESFGEIPGDDASPAAPPPGEGAKTEIFDRLRREEAPARSAPFPAERAKRKKSRNRGPEAGPAGAAAFRAERSLDDVLARVEEPFSPMLFRLIREKDLEEVNIYKRAGIDRKLFSKIRCRDDYAPRKSTVLSLALAMELNLDETLDLLARAGFTLSRSSRSDLIVEYMISEGIFDLFEVNEALYAFGLDPLN